MGSIDDKKREVFED